MSWVWIIAGIVVLGAVLAVTRVLRRFVMAFALAAGLLLGLHMKDSPAEAAAGLSVMVAGLGLARPLRRMLFGGII